MNARVMVRTPDGVRVFDPIWRPLAQAEAIAESARQLASKRGWRLTYFVEAGEV